jgi:hypothetical protein
MDPTLARPTRAPATTIVVAAACLLGAEGIHTAVIAPHFAEWWAEGAFFLALSVLEGALAAALLLAPSRSVAQAAVLASLATIAVWAWSRTTGLPIGPEAGYPEAVGRADTIATLLEALTALALAPVILQPRRGMRRIPLTAGTNRSTNAAVAAVAAVALVTAFGLLGADNHTHAAHAAPAPINVAAATGGR